MPLTKQQAKKKAAQCAAFYALYAVTKYVRALLELDKARRQAVR